MATIALEIRGLGGRAFRGECTLAGCEGFLDAVAIFDSQEMPVQQQGTGAAGRRVGKAVLGDFQIARYVDSASPRIAHACGRGKQLQRISIMLFRTLEGKLVNYATFKLYNCYITRLARQNEDAEGSIWSHQVSDTVDALAPHAGAGTAAALAQRLTSDRPVTRIANPSLFFTPSENMVERLWIQSAAALWSCDPYKNGVRQGTSSAGWHFEEGVDLGESSVARG